MLDGLGEVEHDIVAGTDDTVLRVWLSEELRTAGVLHAGEHLRVVGKEGIAVATEEARPEVVGLLHDCTFAVELGADIAVGRYHSLCT